MAYVIMSLLWWLFPGNTSPSRTSDLCWEERAVHDQACGNLSGVRPLPQQVCLHMVAWTCDQKGK